ncbi:MAG: DUF5723 family protein [Flavobacteriales bacterium]
MRTRTSTIGLLVFASAPVLAQTDMSVFSTTGRAAATTFVTDYQAIGINPANLGWDGRWPKKKVFIGFAEASVSAYSQAFTRSDLRASFLGNLAQLTYDQKVAAAKDIANTDFTLNVDAMSFGAAYRTDAFGGLGFQIRDRAQWNSNLNLLTSDLLFLGSTSNYFDQVILANGDTLQNTGGFSQATIDQIVKGIQEDHPLTLSTLLEGTQISMSWYREYNMSYGRSIIHNDNLELYAGIGLKYLAGIGIIDVRSDGSGRLTAYSALSPFFNLDYGSASLTTNAITVNNGLFPSPVGSGFGMDLGLSAIIKQKWKLGASVTNIGSITWKGNVYQANDALLTDLSSTGIDTYNILNGIDQFVSEDGVLQWQGESKRTVPLAANMRLGAGMLLGQIAELGVDVIVPLNDEPGSYNKPVLGIGGDLRPVKWLQLSAGVISGGDYDTKIPVGITFDVAQGTWEFGVASRDAITFFSENAPTVSLCVGFLRFRF